MTSEALLRQESRITALEASIAEVKASALTKLTMMDILIQHDLDKEERRKSAKENQNAAKEAAKEAANGAKGTTPQKKGGN